MSSPRVGNPRVVQLPLEFDVPFQHKYDYIRDELRSCTETFGDQIVVSWADIWGLAFLPFPYGYVSARMHFVNESD